MYCDSSRNIKTDYRNSVFTGTNGNNFQFSTATGASRDYSGYINKIMGTNTTGFVKDYNNNTDGNTSTYFADNGGVISGYFGGCGGLWDDGAYAGAFYLGLGYSASDASSNIGARLIYKHAGQ